MATSAATSGVPAGPRSGDRRDELAAVVVELTAENGLDAVTVREVAGAAGVSIGTVQHHFGTKDAMLVAAFERVVSTTRARVAATPLGGGKRAQIARVLEQLLPLDDARMREARVHLAFVARAATMQELAGIQAELLGGLREELAEVLGGRASGERAAVLLAVVDGLVLQQVSSSAPLDATTVRRVLARTVDAVL